MTMFRHLLAFFRLPLLIILLNLSLDIPRGVGADSDTIYITQAGTPVGLPNFIEPELGCSWSGVGGQVFDRSGIPVKSYVIRIEGLVEGAAFQQYAVTGGAVKIGPGGYVIKLANRPIVTNGSIRLQVLDLSGAQISPAVQLSTYGDCSHNLLIVNIRELVLQNPVFLPIVRR